MKIQAIITLIAALGVFPLKAEEWLNRFFDAAEANRCDIGPVPRNFGGVSWVVYACRCKNGLALTNSETLRYFFVSVEAGSVKIDEAALVDEPNRTAVLEDVRTLSVKQIEQIIEQAKHVEPSKEPC
ncbi:MAG: hypothetical protein AAF387_18285 [Pseudomonadota bacterium]